jgi:acetyl esterase/lipase
VGDSAGGNIAVQLLSHILHPLDGVPLVPLPAPIGGIYLMSPWFWLSGATGPHLVNDKTDVVGPEIFDYCGRKVLAGVPESSHVYLEASKAQDEWFERVEEVVDRVLITAGARECLKEDIAIFARKIRIYHSDVEFVVQEGGVHNDPYYDFFVAERKMSNLTLLIVDWLAERFA